MLQKKLAVPFIMLLLLVSVPAHAQIRQIVPFLASVPLRTIPQTLDNPIHTAQITDPEVVLTTESPSPAEAVPAASPAASRQRARVQQPHFDPHHKLQGRHSGIRN
ncbi:MAG TPA: hypothetical protein VK627_08215 [Edaphobacter sp.]|nr:hypothetical protein [Edaphobacter sp.]